MCYSFAHVCVCVCVLCPYQGLDNQPGCQRGSVVGLRSDLEEKTVETRDVGFPQDLDWNAGAETPHYSRSS